jgi:hypothetical protein
MTRTREPSFIRMNRQALTLDLPHDDTPLISRM